MHRDGGNNSYAYTNLNYLSTQLGLAAQGSVALVNANPTDNWQNNLPGGASIGTNTAGMGTNLGFLGGEAGGRVRVNFSTNGANTGFYVSHNWNDLLSLNASGHLHATGRMSGSEFWLGGASHARLGRNPGNGEPFLGYNINADDSSYRYDSTGSASGILCSASGLRLFAGANSNAGTSINPSVYLGLDGNLGVGGGATGKVHIHNHTPTQSALVVEGAGGQSQPLLQLRQKSNDGTAKNAAVIDTSVVYNSSGEFITALDFSTYSYGQEQKTMRLVGGALGFGTLTPERKVHFVIEGNDGFRIESKTSSAGFELVRPDNAQYCTLTFCTGASPSTSRDYYVSLLPGGKFAIAASANNRGIYLDSNGRIFQHLPHTAPNDSDLENGSMSPWFDDASDTLNFRIRKSDGTYVTKTL